MTNEMQFLGLAQLKAEGARIPYDEGSGPSEPHGEPAIQPDSPLHRLAFMLCDVLSGQWPYETPYRCIELAEAMIAKGLTFDADALDVSQRQNRGT